MGTVVSMEENMPHVVSEVICVNCKHRWIDVRPEKLWLKQLECPNCKEVGYVIETGQIIDDE